MGKVIPFPLRHARPASLDAITEARLRPIRARMYEIEAAALAAIADDNHARLQQAIDRLGNLPIPNVLDPVVRAALDEEQRRIAYGLLQAASARRAARRALGSGA